jgi:hypothetical protein
MKKKYVYIFPPLLGMVIFGVIFWQYSSGYEARLAESQRKEQAAIQAKLDEDARNRKVAVEAAIAAQEKRKADYPRG